MPASTFRLVLVVSLAHALVHVFELSLPSVEQMIGDEFGVDRERTGMLGTAWRLPFGLGALAAGWLADRFGSKRMLLVYLLGCLATSWMAARAESLAALFGAMFVMGCFASIYHPAGLSLISRETTPENRGAALGWHGIVGSIGIAGAPFLAAVVFHSGEVSWRDYYLFLMLPAGLLAVFIQFVLVERPRQPVSDPNAENPVPIDDDSGDWRGFFVLVIVGALSGFIYGAFLHFLPRYLDGGGMRPTGATPASFRNLLTAIVLGCGIAGQAIAGRLARPGRLERLLVLVLLGSAPLLAWMAFAEGFSRLAATCTLALVHFMNQPVYNSLIAQYVPLRRRSLGYGFSNMLTFGVGALGPTYAGFMQTNSHTYGGLALLSVVAALMAAGLPKADGDAT